MVNKIMVFMMIHLLATVTRPTVLGKWKKAQETDKYIALWGTIYGTSMYSLHVLLQIHREVVC